jgi:hypothetical protein
MVNDEKQTNKIINISEKIYEYSMTDFSSIWLQLCKFHNQIIFEQYADVSKN